MVSLNGFKVKALFDSGNSESFIHPSLVETASLFVHQNSGTVSLATSDNVTKVAGSVLLILPIKTIHMKTFV
jgi:hypothetical protein